MPQFDFTSPDGKSYSVTGPDGATPAQAFGMLQQHLGAASAPAGNALTDIVPEVKNAVVDTATSAASSLGRAFTQQPPNPNGFLADYLSAVPNALSKAGSFFKGAAEGASLPAQPMVGVARSLGGHAIDAADQALRAGAVSYNGGDQNMAPALGYEGSKGVVDTALATMGGKTPTGTVKALPLTPAEVIAKGSAAYQAPEVMAVQIKPAAAQRISDNIIGDLNRARLNDRLAPQTHALLEDLPTPVNGPAHSLEDFQTVRTLLGKQAGNFANPTEQAAASKAIGLLDQHLSSMPQSDLLAGNIADANATLTAGRGDYAAGKAAERVQGKVDNAELQAASAYSGGNIDNATRQKLRSILTSPSLSRGLTAEELESIDQVVRGSPSGNALRAVGKLLGGGGGLGAVVTAGTGAAAAGPMGAALPLVGYGVKKAGDLLTQRAANAAIQQILSRAPSAPSLRPPMPQTLDPKLAALMAAFLSNRTLGPRPMVPLTPTQAIGQ